jgi:hypothetical protein
LLLVCACSTKKKETPVPVEPPVASAPAAAPIHDPHAVPPLAASNLVAATGRACRAKSLKGSAMLRASPDDAPRPLVQGELFPEGARVELAAEADLSVQATVSTREIAVHGPAVLVACPDGDEALRVSSGRVSGYPGMGVRPGSDVWIATPLGVVRFSDAQIDINVADGPSGRVEVKVTSGKATFMPAAGARVAGPADAGTLEELAILPESTFSADRPTSPLTKVVRDLVAACSTEAEAASHAGARVLEAKTAADPAELGQRAFLHVRARQRARAACEVARAAGGSKPGVLDSRQLAQLAAADEKWKRVPTPPSLTPLPTRR